MLIALLALIFTDRCKQNALAQQYEKSNFPVDAQTQKYRNMFGIKEGKA